MELEMVTISDFCHKAQYLIYILLKMILDLRSRFVVNSVITRSLLA